MSLKTKLIYEFGEFRVDVEECRLSRGDEVIALKPKVFEMLILIEQNGRLVKKEELMDRLWLDSQRRRGESDGQHLAVEEGAGPKRRGGFRRFSSACARSLDPHS